MFEEYMQRRKDKSKLIAAIVAAAALLILVFCAAIWVNSDYESDAADAILTELQTEDSLTLVQTGKTRWRYLDGGTAPAPDKNKLNWTLQGYDDSAWKEARGTFGSWSKKDELLVHGISPVNRLNHSLPTGDTVPVHFFRTEFDVGELRSDWRLDGTVEFDDSLVLYLNGRRIYSSNTPETADFTDTSYGAIDTVADSLYKQLTIDDASVLRKGKNVLAVEVHQANKNSTDMFFDFVEMTYHEFQTPQGMPKAGTIILEPGETESSIRINWLVDEKNSYKVEYGRTGQMESRMYNNVIMDQRISSDADVYCYTASVNNLRPDTKYAFRIASQSDAKLSEEFYFQTRALAGKFSFLFVGDAQIGADDIKSDMVGWDTAVSVGESIRPETAFILSAGDQVDSSDAAIALKEYYAFRMPETLKRIPIVTTRGNHESGTELYDLQFKRAGENSVKDSYFTYNGVLFAHINSNNNDYGEHRYFLQKAIERTNPRWIIVNMHYSIFSTGPHSTEKKIVDYRRNFSKLFSEFNVDLVLSGHDHIYARSYLMDGERSTGKNGGKKLPGETMYLTGGSPSGSKYYKRTKEMPEYAAVSVQDEEPSISSIEVSDNELRINTFRISDLEELDVCVITKD